VDLMVIPGGMGDYEAFLNDSEQVTIIVECRNGTDSAAATCRSLNPHDVPESRRDESIRPADNGIGIRPNYRREVHPADNGIRIRPNEQPSRNVGGGVTY